ncbi:N-acetylneuraminate synthase family protein [Paraliomyxa miuraensis]|uniref:N-acetylneuraminate synthase family protein n=1 Tax=Paraliomyxa miuraensis TaxID=376150 RepID=UPI002252DEE2|nr:N-acetylneuraminate synthase family protein [Paraliomyxa miuraensis]MCX4243621.1 N-acetylneuraminate synthase family protein [Paraliomyxa miuraensis]
MSVAKLLEAFRPLVVAEACDNHFGSVDRAFAMIDAAHAAGADVVKFQHHIPHAEMLRDLPLSDNFDESLWEFLERCALSIDDHARLIAHARQRGIEYLCTPFSIDAARELHALGLREFKVGSGELRDLWFLERLAELADHLILSTGMCTLPEIDATVAAIGGKVRVSLMNCTSAYPTRHADVTLGLIPQLQRRYPELSIGHSDHTPDNFTCFGAVALGATMVEKHFTLDRGLGGPDASVSIEPHELANLVTGVRAVWEASRGQKHVREAEAPVRAWAYRSVVTTRAIPQGTALGPEHICTKRPGTGIASADYRDVLGCVAKSDLDANHLLTWDDLYRPG